MDSTDFYIVRWQVPARLTNTSCRQQPQFSRPSLLALVDHAAGQILILPPGTRFFVVGRLVVEPEVLKLAWVFSTLKGRLSTALDKSDNPKLIRPNHQKLTSIWFPSKNLLAAPGFLLDFLYGTERGKKNPQFIKAEINVHLGRANCWEEDLLRRDGRVACWRNMAI